MNYPAELKKFITSQYLFSAVRITLAIVIPALILAQLGLLKEFFLFPLGTSFVALTDQPGPFIRRRNTLILAILSFVFIAFVASMLMTFPILVVVELIVFCMFFTLIGVYGTRLAILGSLALVVLAIFIDGHLTGAHIGKSLLIFSAGCTWFLLVFMVVNTLQPYKLAGQMIGENYLQLAEFLRIKANFYQKNPDFEKLNSQVFAKQILIKNLQEETRETVLKTRTIVNEATTTSRLLMLMFLNSVDLHEKLMTSESSYQMLQKQFGDSDILVDFHNYLNVLSNEIFNIGVALQAGIKAKPIVDIHEKQSDLNKEYFKFRDQARNVENLENFMVLRQILLRINEITKEIEEIYNVFSQDVRLAKSLSNGLDVKKFLPHEEKLNFRVLKNNISFSSAHFRHALRVTIAFLIGYFVSKLTFLGIGHTYWVLITLTAILKPAYSTTKHRNLLRLYGTIVGAVVAYTLLMFVHSEAVLLVLLLLSMILCFSLLKGRYFWAVLFMTMYVFLSFNFLNPGNVNTIFKDRILDTLIAGGIAFIVSYLVLPVWEHTQNINLMKKSSSTNLEYFEIVLEKFTTQNVDEQNYKLKRKNAIIALANLSDNFQKMLSEPKNQQKKLEVVHQFVNTSHLLTAYTASLSLYANSDKQFPEIDFENWNKKISAELHLVYNFLIDETIDENWKKDSNLQPDDEIEELLRKRKIEIQHEDYSPYSDANKVTRLTELQNIHNVLDLIYDVAKEQRKVIEKYRKENPILPQS